MDAETEVIPVPSHRQAMDWSLVLISQGIESVIEPADESRGWALRVAAGDYEPALSALHQYEWENRHWPWQREIFKPGLFFDWASLAWLLLLGVFFWLSEGQLDLRALGRMDSAAVSHGQWWRLFTAVWLHADLSHLASNAGLGFVLLGLTMGRYGTGIGLLAAYLAGVGGNILVWLASPRPSLGASGMVMGCIGLLAIQSFVSRRRAPHEAKLLVSAVIAGVMLFILLGLNPGTDVVAHAGGFLSGLGLGVALSGSGPWASKALANFLAGMAFAILTLWPWWLALRH